MRGRGKQKGGQGHRGREKQRGQVAPKIKPRLGGAPAPLAHLLSGTPSSVRRSGLCPAASEGPLLWPRDSCLRTGTRRGGAGSSTPPSNCPAPLSGPAPARAHRTFRDRVGGRVGVGEDVGSANGSAGGVRRVQWEQVAAWEGWDLGRGQAALGNSSGITKGAGCRGRGQPRAPSKK